MLGDRRLSLRWPRPGSSQAAGKAAGASWEGQVHPLALPRLPPTGELVPGPRSRGGGADRGPERGSGKLTPGTLWLPPAPGAWEGRRRWTLVQLSGRPASQEEAEATGWCSREGPLRRCVHSGSAVGTGRGSGHRECRPGRPAPAPTPPDGTWGEARGWRGHVNRSARQVSALLLGLMLCGAEASALCLAHWAGGAGLLGSPPGSGCTSCSGGVGSALGLGCARPVQFHQGPWRGKRSRPLSEAQGPCPQPEGGGYCLSALSVPAVGEFSQLPGPGH